MLINSTKLPSFNYQLRPVHSSKKYKLNKGQEPSKTLCVTGISGTHDYTAPFTYVIINTYNRILKTSDKDYKNRSDIPSLILPNLQVKK